MLLDVVYFFFSSRRRHTRLTCDWSSDVCSSDLIARPESFHWSSNRDSRPADWFSPRQLLAVDRNWSLCHPTRHLPCLRARSEERRVGKECWCWWWSMQ